MLHEHHGAHRAQQQRDDGDDQDPVHQGSNAPPAAIWR